jgi:hypothetical protein
MGRRSDGNCQSDASQSGCDARYPEKFFFAFICNALGGPIDVRAKFVAKKLFPTAPFAVDDGIDSFGYSNVHRIKGCEDRRGSRVRECWSGVSACPVNRLFRRDGGACTHLRDSRTSGLDRFDDRVGANCHANGCEQFANEPQRCALLPQLDDAIFHQHQRCVARW